MSGLHTVYGVRYFRFRDQYTIRGTFLATLFFRISAVVFNRNQEVFSDEQKCSDGSNVRHYAKDMVYTML